MTPKNELAVVIVAGGKGKRVGADIPKQFLPLAKKPMLMHTIEKFYQFDATIQIVVVLHPDYFDLWKNLCNEYNFEICCDVIAGGKTRFESVKRGLTLVANNKIVAIHDAARPFVPKELIANCFQKARKFKCGVIPVVEEVNSLREVNGENHQPLDRSKVRIVQTPQVFPAHLIKKAYTIAFNPNFTDDATVAENSNVKVLLTDGNHTNFKVTTQTDIKYASFILSNL